MKKTLILTQRLFALLLTANVMADDVKPVVDLDKKGNRIEERLDNRGDRREEQLNNKGDRIEQRLDNKGVYSGQLKLDTFISMTFLFSVN